MIFLNDQFYVVGVIIVGSYGNRQPTLDVHYIVSAGSFFLLGRFRRNYHLRVTTVNKGNQTSAMETRPRERHFRVLVVTYPWVKGI